MESSNVAYTPKQLALTFATMRERREQFSQSDLPRGVDGASAAQIAEDGGRTFREIHRLMSQADSRNGSPTRYRFSPLCALTQRSSSGKERTVVIPTVRDQVTIKAMSDILKEAMSEAGIPQPETDPAKTVRHVIRHARNKGNIHVLRTDIASFYDSIPHDPLLTVLKDMGVDAVTRDLVAKLLRTPYRCLNSEAETVHSRGVPQGASVSGLLAQVYLHRIDGMFEGRTNLFYARYVDDIFLAAPDAARLASARAELQDGMRELGLTLHEEKTEETTFAVGFHFLGLDFRGNKVFVPEEKIESWFRRLCRLFLDDLKATADGKYREDQTTPRDQFHHAVGALNAELSGLTGRHLRLYHVADNVEAYRSLDRRIRRMLAPWLTRLGIRPEYCGVTSALRWAYQHKRSSYRALRKAEERFGGRRGMADRRCPGSR